VTGHECSECVRESGSERFRGLKSGSGCRRRFGRGRRGGRGLLAGEEAGDGCEKSSLEQRSGSRGGG